MNLYQAPIGGRAPEIVRAVIEIPKGSTHKIEYNPRADEFRTVRTLKLPMPAAYGFISSTIAEDGDPMDVIVISEQPLATGDVIEVRPIGILRTKDRQAIDDKVLAVLANDNVDDLEGIAPGMLKRIEQFFKSDPELEVGSWGFSAEAKDEIRQRMYETTVQLGQILSDPKQLILTGLLFIAVPVLVYLLSDREE